MNNKILKKIFHVSWKLKWIHTYIKIIISFSKYFGDSQTIFHESMYTEYTSSLLENIKNKGIKDTIELFKKYQRIGISLAVGSTFEKLQRRRVIKGTDVPIGLRPLYKLLLGSTLDKRIGLTILNIVRLLKLPPSPDISAITNEGAYSKELLSDFTNFVKSCKTDLVQFAEPDISDEKHQHGYITTKLGPNGPSISSIHKDSIALLKRPDLLESIETLLMLTKPMIYGLYIGMMDEIKKCNLDMSKYSYHLGKVSQLSEGGGKTRNIAIIDYWSQNSLQWIHDTLMNRLRRLKTDATYNQEDGFLVGKTKAIQMGVCYSFDLSSATDRFPLDFQIPVLTKVFGEEVVKHWKKLMVDRDFYIPNLSKSVRWAIGQPLGSLSSWASFAFTHHLFVKWCANDPRFDNYIILGDDIMIFDASVASIYSERMKNIGVTINTSKSFLSNDPTNVYGEFSKRIFINNDEITGLPLDMIIEASKSLYMIPEVMSFLKRRWGYAIPGQEIYGVELFSYLRSKGRGLLSKLISMRQIMEATGTVGFPLCCLNIPQDQLKQLIVKKYLVDYQAKLESLFDTASGQFKSNLKSFIERVKKEDGDQLSTVVQQCIQTGVHPLYLVKVKSAADLSNIQEDTYQNLNSLDKLIIEFIPDLTLRPFFVERKVQRSKTFGKISLQLYYDLLNKIETPNIPKKV